MKLPRPKGHLMLCNDCGRPLRPQRANPADHPGTVVSYAKGLCSNCYRLARATAAMPEHITPDEWPRLPGTVRAYLTERRRRLAQQGAAA